MRRRLVPALVGVSLSATLLSGCWGSTAALPEDCGWVAAPSQDAKASIRTVVLIDRSGSYRQPVGERARITEAVVNSSTDDFGESGTRLVSIGAFDGSSTSVDWAVRNASLPVARGTRTRLQARDKASAAACLRDSVAG